MTKKTVSIRLDPLIWKNARVCAAQSELKIGEYVEKALALYTKRPNK